jgi:hypothetical protein
MKQGYGPALPLEGGYRKWKELGYPVENVVTPKK